jgi:dihydropteroate synthase
MPFASRPRFAWKLRTRTLELGLRTLLMGILNVTPDSFSDGNLFLAPDRALQHALTLLDQGADILDLGGESTRPSALPLSPEQEQQRILPVLSAILAARPDAIVSVDTYHAATARLAVEHGAEIINDVSGLHWDPDMARTLAELRPGAVLMHTRGRPPEWSSLPPLQPEEVVPLILHGLSGFHGLDQTLARAAAGGLSRHNIVLDPGFGFGKRGDENFALHAGFARLQTLGLPLLAGTSRKRFLTAHLDKPAREPNSQLDSEARLAASTASNVASILAGAHLLRVHDIPAARAAVAVADAILAAAPAPPPK